MNFLKSLTTLFFLCALGTSAYAAKPLCVSQIQARLRAEPSTKSYLKRVVFENTPLEQISKRGRWIEVRDYSGKNFYIFDSLISTERDCILVLGGTRTYQQPDLDSPTHKERSLAHHLEGLQVIKKDLGFTEVLDRFGNQFWISSSARIWPREL